MGASLSKTVLGMGQEECYENYQITRYAKWLLIRQKYSTPRLECGQS